LREASIFSMRLRSFSTATSIGSAAESPAPSSVIAAFVADEFAKR
jgi:hypothetical protein